ncbi:MAG TPA: hypothetical protein DEA96_18135 [Leptospiraceae bacterium]|nr:hypothetical protein [Spirochaetaceae bacterium]HBS06895.1 hypothetical protein [Leptospiraceae bacterium]
MTHYSGNVSLEELKEGMTQKLQRQDISDFSCILVDTREATLELHPSQMNDLVDFHNSLYAKYPGRTAFLVADPMETAFVELFAVQCNRLCKSFALEENASSIIEIALRARILILVSWPN